jgi:hypothetical protein
MNGPARYTCPICGRTSHNPNDVREGYCGACHGWTAHPSHCHCGAPFNEASGDWRFDGCGWQHYHGYPIGHVIVETPEPMSGASMATNEAISKKEKTSQ